ncbi:dihydrolipoamide acetyltransferase [Hyalangium rubrum]|uniref:Dihydrolipoamide acetyltransferase n=1 Tax=Hyalangium rubrum TaxID=3103134 RepID=A0ABU5H6C2_9BACT|nr:dihydrolipoamide acetyltransferase [Hyalangium sp. s54d21]MDY7229008.1 dihydrolipoamide acetyltransferase [Hyalangium sp. s54d21]
MRSASSSFCLFALLSVSLCLPALAQETPATPAPASPATEVTVTPPASPAAAPAPTSAPSSEAISPTPPGPSAQTADEAFDTRVKTMEEQVVDLKEKIYRSKARLLLLQETVLGGDLSTGARAVLFHKNEMGSSFVLESVAYALDGAPIFTKVNENGDLDKLEEFEIFNGRIVPGQHQVAVRLVYRGNGYGVFSYLEGYKFKVQSSYTFNAEGGKVTTVRVVGFEKGGLTTDLKDRPTVRYDIEVSRDAPQPKSAPKAPAATPTAAPASPPSAAETK